MSKALIITILAIVIIALGATALFITQRQEGKEVREQPVETKGICSEKLVYFPTPKGILELDGLASECYSKLQSIYGGEKAQKLTVEWIRRHPAVASAGLADGDINIEYTNGVESIILTYSPAPSTH